MYKGPTRKFKTKKIRVKRQKKVSQYGLQLLEKQKLRKAYSLREKTLKNYFRAASKKRLDVELDLIQLLEKRLDNSIYRLGWSITRPQAAQLVNHAHIMVNGKNVKIPSYQVSKGDIIEIKASKKDAHPFRNLAVKLEKYTPPARLRFINKEKTKAEVSGEPSREDFTEPINSALVLQFYSR